MDEPEQWRWIWLGVAVLFGVGEMATPGAFFLAPFAIGGAVAAVLAFADVGLLPQWGAFVGVSVVAFLGFRPLAKRLDQSGGSEGVGARRLVGQSGTVLEAVDGELSGLVRVGTEEWRAVTSDRTSLPAGTAIRVLDVQGTRVIVTPAEEHRA